MRENYKMSLEQLKELRLRLLHQHPWCSLSDDGLDRGWLPYAKLFCTEVELRWPRELDRVHVSIQTRFIGNGIAAEVAAWHLLCSRLGGQDQPSNLPDPVLQQQLKNVFEVFARAYSLVYPSVVLLDADMD